MPTRASGLVVQVAQDFPIALGATEVGGALVTTQEWDSLLAAAASDVVFLTWQWQRVWWKHFGASDNCTLHLLVIRDERGALQGIAPLFVASEPLPPFREYTRGVERPVGQGEPQRLVRFVGGIEVADYLDVIAATDDLPSVWSAIFDYLFEHRSEWDAIDLHSLPAWSPSRDIFANLAQERGLEVSILAEDVCPVVELPSDFDAYLMGLRKKDRHELRRKIRKLEGRDDVRWYLVPPRDAEAVQHAVDLFLDLHRKSGADKAHFMNEEMSVFFRETAQALLDTGWLDLAILEVDAQPAAAYFSFNYHDRIYLYNSGYDPKFAAYSAGIALLVYRIHKAINQGCKFFDFLRGDEDYKYDFGGKDTSVYRAYVR